jgi:hypothetical protein
MSFAKKSSGDTTTGDSGKGSGSGSTGDSPKVTSDGKDHGCAGCLPKPSDEPQRAPTPDETHCSGCCGGAADCQAPPPPPTPTTPNTPNGSCVSEHVVVCPSQPPTPTPIPLIPNPNGGGTYCPGDSSTRCFKDEKEYARALWQNGIRKTSDCAGFDDQSECQQAVKDFHCTLFANCNNGNGQTTTTTSISTITGGLTSVQLTNLSARIAQLQSLMSKPYGAECKSQIQTLMEVTQQALDAQNAFIADHLPTLQQGIPACYGSNAEQITETS